MKLGKSISAASTISVAVIVLGAIIRFSILTLDYQRLDNAFVVDDAYYTLAISKNIAQYGIPSADGIEGTTGFQPLLAFLETPVFIFTNANGPGVIWMLFVLICADLGVVILLTLIARRIATPTAGAVVATMASFSVVGIQESLVGLEGTLASAAGLGVALLADKLFTKPSGKYAAALGMAIGIALLARIDTAFIAVVVGIGILIHQRTHLTTVVLVAFITSAPWLLYCWYQTGAPWPESGDAVQTLIDEGTTFRSLAMIAGWATGYCAPGTVVDIPSLRQLLVELPIAGASALILFGTGYIFVGHKFPNGIKYYLWGVFLLVPFYIFVLPAIWGFHRYLLPVRTATTLIIAITLSQALLKIPTKTRIPIKITAAALLLCHCLFSLATALSSPARGGIDRTTGYGAVAAHVFAALPPKSVVAAFQSGALSYFKPDNITVVNLDGVVSARAHRAMMSNSVSQYAQRRGVTHLAGWNSGFKEFHKRSSVAPPRLLVFSEAPPQGQYRFYLARLSSMEGSQ